MTAAFTHIGGDIFWTGDMSDVLNSADVDYLKRAFRDECEAAFRAGDEERFERFQGQLASLILALAKQLAWLRCARAV